MLSNFLRVENSVVVESIKMSPDDFAFYYPASFRAGCVESGNMDIDQGWTYGGETFAPPPQPPEPTLEEVRAVALAALREKRKAVEYGGFLFNGQRWDSEQKDELRLNSALKMFEMTGMPEFSGWKIAEGTYVTATLELLQGAALSLMQHYAATFAVEAVKGAELLALETQEAVAEWMETALGQGWPGQAE